MRLLSTLLLCAIFSTSSAQQKSKHIVYFDFDKDVPYASAQAELTSLIKELSELQASNIEVKGHTDLKGSNAYNNKLSLRRAENVAVQLKQALPETSVTISFFGEEELLSEEEVMQGHNRRVEIFYSVSTSSSPSQKTLEVEGFFEDVPEQIFYANVSDTIRIRGRQGTTLKISPGSLQTKDGKFVKGQVEIKLKEYYEPGDILLSGMHSVSDRGLLQTGGMFVVTMMQGAEVLSEKMKKEVEIRLPVRNEALNNMNVFTLNNQGNSLSDSSNSIRWSNSGREFLQTVSYWVWPQIPRLEPIAPHQHVNFEGYRTGAVYSDEYDTDRPLIGWGKRIPSTKRISIQIKKIDSVTLQVNAKLKYRNKGYKRYGIRSLDTSFIVPFRVAEYYSNVPDLKYINCDRFWKNKNNTEFFVHTPGFKGLNVAVYFKSQSAYMQSPFIGDKYVLNQIPQNENVIVIAYGRDGDKYFFGKQSYVIAAQGNVSVKPAEMTKEEFNKLLKTL